MTRYEFEDWLNDNSGDAVARIPDGATLTIRAWITAFAASLKTLAPMGAGEEDTDPDGDEDDDVELDFDTEGA